MASGYKPMSKEDYISFFNQYTNNIFKDDLPPDFDNIITDMTSAKSNSTDPNRKTAIIKKIITPYYDKLSFGTLSPLTAQTSTIKKTRPLKQKNFYLTNLFPKNKRLLVGINSDDHKEKLEESMTYVWSVLNTLRQNADGKFEEYKDKIKSQYSVIIIDNSDTSSKYTPLHYIKLGTSGGEKNKFIYFWKETFDEGVKFLPILAYDFFAPPETKSFLHSLEEAINISPDLKETLSPLIKEDVKVIKEDVRVIKVIDDKPDDKQKYTTDTSTSVVDREDAVSDKLIKNDSVEELSYNPYDKNQDLRVISLEGLTSKYLLGRAKFDKSEDSFNLYEDSPNNKLVGMMTIDHKGDDSIGKIAWCTDYSPK
jgi:hypothetical protein